VSNTEQGSWPGFTPRQPQQITPQRPPSPRPPAPVGRSAFAPEPAPSGFSFFTR
jgi:hypothetical protein